MEQYISLSAIAGRFSELSPGYVVQSWLRDRSTLEFLMQWESKHNSVFDIHAYGRLWRKQKKTDLL